MVLLPSALEIWEAPTDTVAQQQIAAIKMVAQDFDITFFLLGRKYRSHGREIALRRTYTFTQ